MFDIVIIALKLQLCAVKLFVCNPLKVTTCRADYFAVSIDVQDDHT
jgi:hypothetical protein